MISAKKLCRAAIVAALYVTLTLLTQPLSYGFIQCRVAESLCILPLFFPETVIGLTVGCAIANMFGNGILDIILGALATFLASNLTAFVGKKIKRTPWNLILGEFPPIILNALILPLTWLLFTDGAVYLVDAAWIAIGQLIAVGVGGTVLYLTVASLRRRNVKFFLDYK